MKYKITRKLVLYFTSVILLFSLVVGGAFLLLFTRHTEEIYRADMQERAEAIAAGVADYLEDGSPVLDSAAPTANGNATGKQIENSSLLVQSGATGTTGRKNVNGYNAYITAIQDIAMGEVWIVDQSAETISVGTGKKAITYAELLAAALALVDEVFEGDVAFSEGFSPLLEDTSITVGAPVLSSEGEVIAAVLLHDYIANMTAVRSGFSTLGISLALALIAAVGIAVLLAKRFIQPLKKMEETTQQLADNHYEAHTGIVQNDEMGSLAANIDILAEKLAEAAQESAKLDKMRKDFITSISHELRTPWSRSSVVHWRP